MKRLALFLFAAFISVAQAQETPTTSRQENPDTPIGTRNPAAPEETAQFDFVIGDWDVVINWHGPDGQVTTYEAKWHNIWIVDGRVVMQEWRGPYIRGAEMRQFDAQAGHWVGFNIYPGGGVPKPTTANFVDGEMMVVIEGTSDARGDFLNRETYFNIEVDSWETRSDRSYDEGATWERGAYDMVATRSR